MKALLPVLLILSVPALNAPAEPETFDFKDPKGVNTINFRLDAPLEPVNGNANGISGTISFDPENPGAAKGKIVVATASLTVPNPMQTKSMLSKDWLDADGNPKITFESSKIKNVKTSGTKTTADVVGTFTLKGISKPVTIPVEFTYLKGKLGDRMSGRMHGDLLVLRGTFDIKRSDFDIMPGKVEDKVSETINLTLGIVGACAK